MFQFFRFRLIGNIAGNDNVVNLHLLALGQQPADNVCPFRKIDRIEVKIGYMGNTIFFWHNEYKDSVEISSCCDRSVMFVLRERSTKLFKTTKDRVMFLYALLQILGERRCKLLLLFSHFPVLLFYLKLQIIE